MFAEQDLQLRWRVANVGVERQAGRLALAHVDALAGVAHASPAVVGRGTLLVKAASGGSGPSSSAPEPPQPARCLGAHCA